MRLPLPRASSVVFSLASLALAGVIAACAKGQAPYVDLGDTTVPADPAQSDDDKLPPSNTLPTGDGGNGGNGDNSDGGDGDDASATTDDASSPAADSGASVDAGVDAGPPPTTCVKVAPSNACGLSPQCGCTATQTCDVTNGTTGAVSCVSAGSGAVGTPCTSTTQCAHGTTCAYNTCRPYCPTIGTTCAGAGLGQCEQYYDPTQTAVTNSQVCAVLCDPTNPSGTCGTNNCIFDDTVDATDCDKAGSKGLWDACSRYNDCAQGLGCVDNPFFGLECEPWCRLGSGDCGAFDCVDVYGAVAPTSGGVKLGHCQ